MDPQMAAMIQALAGAPGSSPSALSPYAPGSHAMAGGAGAYSLPQDPMQIQPSGMLPQPGAPPSGGAGQNASMGDQGGLSLGTGQQQQPNMYGAMMTPPPAPNYWG